MRSLFETPIEQTLVRRWNGIALEARHAFLITIAVSVLAFGFEMTNLTLHHDDVIHFFIQDTILGHYLGRFGFGWLHYYTQNHYIMPFLQMAEGIVLMSLYGVLVARFWGSRTTIDVALVATIVSVFPYMAHIYQYNTSMVPFPLAHLLAALAVVVSARARIINVVVGSLLFVAAFSIYQAVVANAATIFVVWLLSKALFGGHDAGLYARSTVRAGAAILASVIVGGLVYLVAVSMMHLEPDTIHSSEEAFRLGGALNWSLSIPEIVQGTRSFFVWPEHYFPSYLKGIQLAFIAAAGLFCLWLPKSPSTKFVALLLLVLACFTPRVLQLVHPKGQFHSLTLTAYAVLIAGAVMIVNRAGGVAIRNLSIVVSTVLVMGYVIQSNWISTVNYLNTAAHFATMTQVLSRVRAVPDTNWDGKTIAVVGTYDMPGDYPFYGATGVASKFMDANHMNELARLARDGAKFVAADASMPKVLEYAAAHAPWPAPGSVGVVDGMGVVVFSRARAPSP